MESDLTYYMISYLCHFAMQAHGIKAEIAQNQRHPDRTACVSNVTLNKQESLLIRVYTTPPPPGAPLGVVARGAEDHKRVAAQLLHQIGGIRVLDSHPTHEHACNRHHTHAQQR